MFTFQELFFIHLRFKNMIFIYFQPITLINTVMELAPAGKIPLGITNIPFELPLKARYPLPGAPAGCGLLETYHGVFVNIMYTLKCNMKRSFLNKPLNTSCQFFVQYHPVSYFCDNMNMCMLSYE